MFEFQIGQGQESDIICLSYLHKGGKLENRKMMEASGITACNKIF
jgi:hypothetical protein